jgi:hypothetical protein
MMQLPLTLGLVCVRGQPEQSTTDVGTWTIEIYSLTVLEV